MNEKILYIGLDVDDTHYHGSAFNKETDAKIRARADMILDRATPAPPVLGA